MHFRRCIHRYWVHVIDSMKNNTEHNNVKNDIIFNHNCIPIENTHREFFFLAYRITSFRTASIQNCSGGHCAFTLSHLICMQTTIILNSRRIRFLSDYFLFNKIKFHAFVTHTDTIQYLISFFSLSPFPMRAYGRL